MKTKRYAWFMACCLLALATGCASTPKPTVVKLSIEAAPDLNPDTRGRASPVVVRFLELKSLAGFESADFFSLFDRDRETLAAELLAREEFLLKPGEQRTLERKLNIDTRHVGVVAAYRDLERSRWRTNAAVPPEKVLSMTIRLEARAVSIKSP